MVAQNTKCCGGDSHTTQYNLANHAAQHNGTTQLHTINDGYCKHDVDLQKITISKIYKKKLINHAEKEKPNESCALLFGRDERVSRVLLTKNIQESPTNFAISADELIDAYRIADRSGIEMAGIFHSHPSSVAYPSETDKKFMRVNPVAWVIYSSKNGEFKAYVLTNSKVVEIQIETV